MFEEILVQISTAFNRHKIPYMITGGQAVLLYGEPRLTRDIDLTIGVNIDHLDKILNIVQSIQLKPLTNEVIPFVKETMVLPVADEKTGIRIDIVFSFTPYEKLAISRAKKVKIKGHWVSFASVEDMIIHKIFAGRPRDIEDIKSIVKRNKNLNQKYLKHWLTQFDKSFKGRNFLSTYKKILMS